MINIAAHGLAISAFMGIWLDYSGERSGMGEAALNRDWRQAERRTTGQILPNLGVRYTLPDDPDQVRALSIAAYTREQLTRLTPNFAEHPDAFAPEPPALALDNVLPEDTTAYTQQKVLDLLTAGARTIWLLYPLIPCVVLWSAGRAAPSVAQTHPMLRAITGSQSRVWTPPNEAALSALRSSLAMGMFRVRANDTRTSRATRTLSSQPGKGWDPGGACHLPGSRRYSLGVAVTPGQADAA